MTRKRKIVFTTKDLRIAEFSQEDLDDFIYYRNNSEWMKYQGFKGLSRAEYEAILLKPIDLYSGAQLAILLGGRLIGDLYLKIHATQAEIGFTLHPKYTGRGYCTQALKGLINYLKTEHQVRKIVAETHCENKASQKVLLNLGFKPVSQEDSYIQFQQHL